MTDDYTTPHKGKAFNIISQEWEKDAVQEDDPKLVVCHTRGCRFYNSEWIHNCDNYFVIKYVACPDYTAAHKLKK